MSEEQLKAFLEAVRADTGLQEKLKAASDADSVVAIAKAAGFVISADSVAAQAAEVLLSDEELKGVAGGIASDCEVEQMMQDLQKSIVESINIYQGR